MDYSRKLTFSLVLLLSALQALAIGKLVRLDGKNKLTLSSGGGLFKVDVT